MVCLPPLMFRRRRRGNDSSLGYPLYTWTWGKIYKKVVMADVTFSEIYKHSSGLCQYSKDNEHLAVAVQHRLVIRDPDSMQIKQVYTCLDTINDIKWSKDSKYVITVILQRAMVQVWSIDKPEWTCRINEGLAGLVGARWAPNSRTVLTFADFNLHVTCWSLTDGTAVCIKNPKNIGNIDFSPDGKFCCLAHRHECRDSIGIYSTKNWGKALEFPTNTLDLSEIKYSPDGSAIAVIDAELNYTVQIFSPDGTRLAKYCAYENALGIKSFAFSPKGNIAIGSYDESVRILSQTSWKCIADLVHTQTVSPQHAHVYCEVISSGDDIAGKTAYQLVTRNRSRLKSVTPDATKPFPRIGVGSVSWSYNDEFVATKNDNMPHAVWIWSSKSLSLYAVLIHRNVVRSFRWSPKRAQLAICTGTNKCFFWSVDGASWVDIPSNDFDVRGIRWSPNGKSLTFLQTKRFCTCYFQSHVPETGTGKVPEE